MHLQGQLLRCQTDSPQADSLHKEATALLQPGGVHLGWRCGRALSCQA